MRDQNCPICQVTVEPSSRYPRYLCFACAQKVASLDGRPLVFNNASLFGGFVALYADTRDAYDSNDCYVNGIKCHAGEHRFGGIVVQVAD